MTRTLELLEDARTFVRRYVVLPDEHHAAAMALWVAHTWAIDAAHATPYLLVLSAERRSGKSRLLEVVALLVRKPWSVVAASEAAMFRKIAAERPTLLLDELDAIFGSDAERTEWLRAVLNAGNRPGVAVARCVGPGHEVRDFEVFCPKLLAGIDTGRLPDTIRDRAVELRLQRKTDDEPVARFRQRYAEIESLDLRNRLEEWAAEHEDALRAAEPNLPNALNDRAADAWEALLAIADLAGGQWPALARDAAVALIPSEEEANPHGSRVLAVLRHIKRRQPRRGHLRPPDGPQRQRRAPVRRLAQGRGHRRPCRRQAAAALRAQAADGASRGRLNGQGLRPRRRPRGRLRPLPPART